MSKVYVTCEQPRKDISRAANYGELVVMLPPISITHGADKAAGMLRQELQAFTKDDYLLLIGDPVLIGIATAIAADLTGGHLQFLKYERDTGEYLVVKATNLLGSQQ